MNLSGCSRTAFELPNIGTDICLREFRNQAHSVNSLWESSGEVLFVEPLEGKERREGRKKSGLEKNAAKRMRKQEEKLLPFFYFLPPRQNWKGRKTKEQSKNDNTFKSSSFLLPFISPGGGKWIPQWRRRVMKKEEKKTYMRYYIFRRKRERKRESEKYKGLRPNGNHTEQRPASKTIEKINVGQRSY